MTAGRILIARLDELVEARVDFALESTLSGVWLAHRIPNWQNAGYQVEIHYTRLRDADLAAERIRTRVSEGGHHVPDEAVRRRFQRSWHLFETLYRNRANRWIVYDNSQSEPRIIEKSE